jgi:DNA-binding PadR family transcriptional regulator
LIKRLSRQGLIAEAEERAPPQWDDKRRRYYRLTPLGRAVASAEARRMERALELARGETLLEDPEPA